MSDIFVIAEEEIILAFRLVGADGIAVGGREEALEAFRHVTTSNSKSPSGRERQAGRTSAGTKVLVLTEDISDLLEEEVRTWQLKGEYPLVVEIPSQSGRATSRKSIVDAVREAVGVMI